MMARKTAVVKGAGGKETNKQVFTPGIDNLLELFMAVEMSAADFGPVADNLLSKFVPTDEVCFWTEELERIRRLPDIDSAVKRFTLERSNDSASGMLTLILQEMVVSASSITKKVRELEREKVTMELTRAPGEVQKRLPGKKQKKQPEKKQTKTLSAWGFLKD
jgi:hypothetical protein